MRRPFRASPLPEYTTCLRVGFLVYLTQFSFKISVSRSCSRAKSSLLIPRSRAVPSAVSSFSCSSTGTLNPLPCSATSNSPLDHAKNDGFTTFPRSRLWRRTTSDSTPALPSTAFEWSSLQRPSIALVWSNTFRSVPLWTSRSRNVTSRPCVRDVDAHLWSTRLIPSLSSPPPPHLPLLPPTQKQLTPTA